MTGAGPAHGRGAAARPRRRRPDAFAELFRRHRDRLWAVALRTTRRPRGRRRRAAGRAAVGAPRRGPVPRRGGGHHLAAPHRGERLPGPAPPPAGAPDRAAARPASADDDDRHAPARNEPAAPGTDHDTALVVRAALAELPAEQRAALVLVDVQGYSVAEVAQILGVAEGTIKSRCSRGRARLAVMLGHLRNLSRLP